MPGKRFRLLELMDFPRMCQSSRQAAGDSFLGMAPCGPLYSLQRVSRRQDLDWSQPFGIGEPIRDPPYSAGKIKSELITVIESWLKPLAYMLFPTADHTAAVILSIFPLENCRPGH